MLCTTGDPEARWQKTRARRDDDSLESRTFRKIATS